KRLTLGMLREVFEGTMKTTAMIMLIVIGAATLNFMMSGIGLTTALTNSISNLGVSPATMLLIMVVFYLILDCFMETLSMMVTTILISARAMIVFGFDPLWLGIVIIILIEAGLITLSVGLNIFVIQSLRPSGSMNAVMLGSFP